MFINKVLENIEECEMAAKEFGAALQETPIEKRSIFTVKENEFTDKTKMNEEIDKRKKCYKAMIGILNETKGNLIIATEDKRLKSLRRLLREVWKKYESNLRVNNYNAEEIEETKEKSKDYKGKAFYEGENGWGVGINLEQDTKYDWDPYEELIETGAIIEEEEKRKKIGWRVAYHTIFHEFFHNIDYAANPDENKYFSCAYEGNEFGRLVENEIKELLDKENDTKNKASEKRLNYLTYNVPKREKAALYDLIGGVLYRGKYGCYPPNSEFYNKGKDGKSEKCKVRFLCSALSETKTETANCKYKERCNPQECGYGKDKFEKGYQCFYGRFKCYEPYNGKVYSNKTCNWCHRYKTEEEKEKKYKCFPKVYECRYRCNNAGKCIYNYKTECSLEIGNWCNNIFGHGIGYWGEKPKKNSKSSTEFLECLATEAFAHFAAEAIVNPEAYKRIRECLPDSEKKFREIISKILCEKLKKFRELWE